MVKYPQSSQNIKFAKSLQYLQKQVRDKVVFYMQINIKVSYKLILSLLMGMIKRIQINKFAISLQYFKKEVRGEVLSKHQGFYKLELFCPKFSK